MPNPLEYLLRDFRPKSGNPRKALVERFQRMKELGQGVAPALWDPDGALEQALEAQARELEKPGKGGRPRRFTVPQQKAMAAHFKRLQANGESYEGALAEVGEKTGASRATVYRAVRRFS